MKEIPRGLIAFLIYHSSIQTWTFKRPLQSSINVSISGWRINSPFLLVKSIITGFFSASPLRTNYSRLIHLNILSLSNFMNRLQTANMRSAHTCVRFYEMKFSEIPKAI